MQSFESSESDVQAFACCLSRVCSSYDFGDIYIYFFFIIVIVGPDDRLPMYPERGSSHP